MSLLRQSVLHSSLARQSLKAAPSLCQNALIFQQFRGYASKQHKNKKEEKEEKKNEKAAKKIHRGDEEYNKDLKNRFSTDSLVPASQLITSRPDYVEAKKTMETVTDKFRKEVAIYETRASGRITPAMLAPVRVTLHQHPTLSGNPTKLKLEEIATVGVKDGTTLVVTVFDEHALKHVEQGIYDAKLPHVIPQRVDSRTIKIPIPKPTVEARMAFYTSAMKQAEDARVVIRKQYTTSIKKGQYKKHTPEQEEFQKLSDQFVAEVDKILADFKKQISGVPK
ncbi:ribosome recycling factor domain-containing protein [Abortiporus biennis]|nr:ribosome recycling factor domain-containing protein [Abortiporus biennis]